MAQFCWPLTIGEEVRKTIIVQSERLGCEIVELNVQVDHVHLLIKVPPKVSISSLMGVMKGNSAIRVFSKFPELKQRPYWGNHRGQFINQGLIDFGLTEVKT